MVLPRILHCEDKNATIQHCRFRAIRVCGCIHAGIRTECDTFAYREIAEVVGVASVSAQEEKLDGQKYSQGRNKIREREVSKS